MSGSEETDLQRTQLYLPRLADLGAGGSQQRLPVLVVLRGAQVGRRYLLNEDALVLGRRPDRSQLVIAGDPQVSSAHCRIERDGSGWRIVDLQSTNGTNVGERRVDNALLRDGDRIHLGATVLKFTFHDELEEAFHHQVDHLMNIDDLTGLPVQRVFQQRFVEALRSCRGAQRPLAVYMLDLDGLKKINDSYGHLVGARAIATVGRRLGTILGAHNGTVSRFGGDEFSAFVPDLAGPDALALGERLRVAVADEKVAAGTAAVQPTISIGVACFPADGAGTEALTRRADEALYRAKNDGRNCVRT